MFTPKFFTEIRNYSKAKFVSDLLAGITVGIVALPLAMAFSIACGLPPERGIFTGIVAGFLISLLGGSKVQIGGPTGAFVVIVANLVTNFGYEGLVLCTLMAGVILIVFGICKMGGLIRFIPFSVTTGFTSGIAVVIFSTQIKDLLGLNMGTPSADIIGKWSEYFSNISTINISATSIGIGTILIIVILKKISSRIPGMLIAMMLATLVAFFLKLDVETIGSRFGQLPRMLPSPSLPGFDFGVLKGLVAPAFTVAILAAIESLLSATVADGMTGGKHRPNIELIAQGCANIGSVIFGGIPATGAIARTATNIKSGAKTPVAGIIHAMVLLIVMMLFAPLAKMIPLAALAGILVVVSYNMSEIGHFRSLFRGPKSDIMVLVTTFLLTIFIDLTVAVEVGVMLSALLFIRRMAEISNVGIITKELRGDEEIVDDPNAISIRQVPDGVEVFEIQGPFFFGVVDKFKNSMQLIEKPVPVVILRMRNATSIDATAIHALKEFYLRCKKDGTTLILSGVHTQPLFALEQYGLLDMVGVDNIFGNIDDSLNRARQILGLPETERPVPFVPTVAREK